VALEIGTCKAKILNHSLAVIGDKMAVRINVETEHGDETDLLVFITDKSMGIARAQLKLCGFDVDTTLLEKLDADSRLLAGTEIPILIEPWNGKLRAGILLNPKPTKDAVAHAQAGLRAVKTGNASADDDLPF